MLCSSNQQVSFVTPRDKQPGPDCVRANPKDKTAQAQLLKSGEVKPVPRACQWHGEISEGKISEEKFRKLFDVQLSKHYGNDLVCTARSESRRGWFYYVQARSISEDFMILCML